VCANAGSAGGLRSHITPNPSRSFTRVTCKVTISCDVTHSHVTGWWVRGRFIPWRDTPLCAMTHSYVCRESFLCVLWSIHTCAMHMWHADESGVATLRHATLKCVTWLTHMCAMTHSYAYHDSFLCVPWLTRTCAMTHAYVTCGWVRGRYIASRNTQMCDMTHSYVCHDSLVCVPWLIHMCAMTHSYVCHASCICDMRMSQGML